MEKVLDTIKQSCSDLKTKKVIDNQQYRLCEQLFQKQKWTENMNSKSIQPQIDILTEKHMQKYTQYKQILDNSFKMIPTATNKNHYLDKIEYTNKELKKNIEEFKKQSDDSETNTLFKEYLAKQTQVNKNKKTLDKQENNLEFIRTKQNNISEEKEIENMRLLIYSVIIGISVLMIIIISVSILYYAN